MDGMFERIEDEVSPQPHDHSSADHGTRNTSMTNATQTEATHDATYVKSATQS